MPRCHECCRESPRGSIFCLQCGARLRASTQETAGADPGLPAERGAAAPGAGRCRRCGAETGSGFVFCQRCGVKLAVAGEAPASSGRAEISPPAAPGDCWGTLVAVKRDGSDGDHYPLAGDWLEVGRSGADISFPNDRFLAPRHARFERGEAGPRVVPLDVLNGVFRRIQAPTLLRDGEVLLAGRQVLRFEVVDEPERQAAPLWRHGVALFASPLPRFWGRLVQLLASAGAGDIRHLAAEAVVIGREEGDIRFADDPFLSRRHAVLSRDGTRCLVADLGSANGTFLRLTEPANLESGDQLRLGDQLFRFSPCAPR